MATLNIKVKKYLEANSKVYEDELDNFVLQNDTGTDYIKSWNVSGLTEPTAEQLATYEDVANTEEDLNVILSNRSKAYPAIADQLDMQYWDKVNDTSTWQDAVQAVKDKYPKS
jgi:hypothetical protein|tara:strand:+ start:584 stop:922 length:339 start_codon:yes stop_codon:yes gene_type:complete